MSDSFSNPFGGTSGEQVGGARYPTLTDGEYIVATRQCISKNKHGTTTGLVIHEFDVAATLRNVNGTRRPQGGGPKAPTVSNKPGDQCSYLITMSTISAKRNLAGMARSFLGVPPNAPYDEVEAGTIVRADPRTPAQYGPGEKFAGRLHKVVVVTTDQKGDKSKDYSNHYWTAIDQEEARRLIAASAAESTEAGGEVLPDEEGDDLDM